MKIKSSIYVCMSLIGALFSVHAAEQECPNKVVEFSDPKATRPKNASKKMTLEEIFPFEIEYKGDQGQNISVNVDNGTCNIVTMYKMGKIKGPYDTARNILRLSGEDIDTNKEIIITIRLSGRDTITYNINAHGKTVYLKWENDKLQTRGGFGATFRKTPSGLSEKNNVSEKDIQAFDRNGKRIR